MFYKVKTIKPLKNFNLLAVFENGEERIYSVKPLFEKWKPFKALENTKGLFEQIKIDGKGFGVSWNEDIDLSCDELYYNGQTIPMKTT